MSLRILTLGLILAGSPFFTAYAQERPCDSYNQKFRVFLESNVVGLTSEAEAVIEQAFKNIAPAADKCFLHHITIVAHTDTQGSTQKNLYLSQAIAENIKDELVNAGINPDIIQTSGRGESSPTIPTTDNVREPINRRAEIKITVAKR